MESIGAFEAKTRLSELLERAAKGETFEITKHGRVVARLVPGCGYDRERARDAAERLKAEFRGLIPGRGADDLISTVHEGHRV